MQGEFRQVLDSVREEMKVLRQDRTVRDDKLRGGPSLNDGSGVSDEREDVKPVRQIVDVGEQMVPGRDMQQQRRPQQMQSISRTASYEEEDRRPEAICGEVVPEVVGDVGELSIPIEHTTAAQKLLRWPSIQELFSRNQTSYDENYVMELEETRGLLRVYGRGEGADLGDGGQPGPSSPAPSVNSVKSEDQAFSPSTPPEGLWGTGFASPTSADTKRAVHEGIGGLTPDGTLKIDPQTCVGLLRSYMDNIHILHPFLDKNRLTRMFDRFAKRYNPSEYAGIRSPFVTSNGIVSGDIRRDSAATLNNTLKRKHSSSNTSDPPRTRALEVAPHQAARYTDLFWSDRSPQRWSFWCSLLERFVNGKIRCPDRCLTGPSVHVNNHITHTRRFRCSLTLPYRGQRGSRQHLRNPRFIELFHHLVQVCDSVGSVADHRMKGSRLSRKD